MPKPQQSTIRKNWLQLCILVCLVIFVSLQMLQLTGVISARLSLGNQYATIDECLNACQISCNRRSYPNP